MKERNQYEMMKGWERGEGGGEALKITQQGTTYEGRNKGSD